MQADSIGIDRRADGYGGLEPKAFRTMPDRLGLSMPSTQPEGFRASAYPR